MASDARVVVGGGFSALAYLAQLSAEERSALTWIRGPEGLSAIGSGAIEVFEPLEAHAGLTSRRAFYEASQMGLPTLPSWDEAQASWLAALNSLGRILGWSQIDSLESFQWMPYEDGTLIPIAGEWLRGASLSIFTEIPVLFPPDETETARLVDGWNFDAERLGLSQRWQHVAWPKEVPFQAEHFIATCRDLARGGGILALMKLPIGLSWFEVRDALRAAQIELMPVAGIGGRGIAYEALERLRAALASEVKEHRRARVSEISTQDSDYRLTLPNETVTATHLVLALGRGQGLWPHRLPSDGPRQATMVGSMGESQSLLSRGIMDAHRLALQKVEAAK